MNALRPAQDNIRSEIALTEQRLALLRDSLSNLEQAEEIESKPERRSMEANAAKSKLPREAGAQRRGRPAAAGKNAASKAKKNMNKAKPIGRPKINANAQISSANQLKQSSPEATNQIRRGRGRPKKVAANNQQQEAPANQSATQNTTVATAAKKRGRPPKIAQNPVAQQLDQRPQGVTTH